MENRGLPIELPRFSNIQNFENLLSKNYKKSFTVPKVEFNLASLEWVGVLQLSILYGWITDLINNDVKVIMNIQSIRNDSQAISFLSNIKYFEESTKIGVLLSGITPQSDSYDLAAFKRFENKKELESYEEALNEPESVNYLLQGGADVDIIRDGDLREIILHEVGYNAFIHGEGKNVRYAVIGYPSSLNRRTHKFLSTFRGKSFVEVVVSDSGKGLLNTLKSAVPDEYHPDAIIEGGKLSKGAKTIAYAFEFSSTCDEEDRKIRLAKIFNEGGDITQAIPTGLFYVATLATLYGGQILVRTGDIITSLDFSTSTKMKISSESKHEFLDGTHILFRVPRARKIIAPVKRKFFSKLDSIKGNFLALHLGKIRNDATSDEEFLIKVEKEFQKNTLNISKSRNPIIILLGDGLRVDTKAFSLLLIILALIPRRNCALLFLGLRAELVDSSLRQWERITYIEKNRLRLLEYVHGFKAFILAGDDLEKIVLFGHTTHHGATVFKEYDDKNSYLEFTRADIFQIYYLSLKSEISKVIDNPPVKHPEGYYYLIEDKYYSEVFYEIGNVIKSQSGRDLSLNYFRMLLKKYNIKVIFIISEPLRKLSRLLEISMKGVRCYQRELENERQSFIRAITDKKEKEKLLILTDVICRANEIEAFLNMVPNLDEVVIACFVDARDNDLSYYMATRESRSFKVSIVSILKRKITPIFDLPTKPDLKILIIDPKTHSPTSYDRIEKTVFQPDQLIESATKSGSFFHGHFCFNGKHYTDFMVFTRLFNSLRNELYSRWDCIFKDFEKYNINRNDISVFYFSEKEGWESLVEDYMSTKSVAACISITKQQLDAPPDPEEALKAIWFILPAIASGNTTMKCLEYGSRFNPKRIYISIIIARLDSTHLSFYQNITGYRKCKNVEVEMLGWLPITAYPDISSCPLCYAEKLIDDVISKSNGFDYLSKIAERGKDLFRCREVTLSDFNSGNITPATKEESKQALIRNDYEEARRSIPHRKEKLGPSLYNLEVARRFIEMVGSDYIFEGFSEQEVQRVTYKRFENIKKEAMICINDAPAKGLSLNTIFGIHRLFSDMLVQNYKRLIQQAIVNRNQELFENLVLLALIVPEKYGLCIAGLTDVSVEDEWFRQLLKEIRTYPHWHNTDSTYAIQEFMKLLWLLRRSTSWGSNLEILRVVIQTEGFQFEEIKKTFSVLESQGINDVLHCINQLKDRENRNPGGLWSVISSGNSGVESTVQNIKSITRSIEKLMNQGDETVKHELLDLLDRLDKAGRKLTNHLNYLFTNPIEVKMKIEELISKRWPYLNIKIDFDIAEDQPGILFGLEDLIQSINLIIENAVDCVTEHGMVSGKSESSYWIRFSFIGYTEEKLASTMLVRDNLPWKSDIVPSGGMKQFIEYCRKYAAIYEFFKKAENNDNVKIKVIFRIDDKRERHDYK